ncbi:MAG TPA: chromate efflux transporter [Gemmatimonadales bacterium]|nr:chromate efflux transporter [Gemmatimonadales bacterium]
MRPSLAEATRFWLKLGFISFGGPAGQIAIMHRELVEERGWIVESRFLHALNFCMFLPGPEAAQLAIYIGWLLHGTPGGLIAGVLFVLPSVFILWGLSLLYATYASLGWVAAIFYGLKAAVLAIVAHALIRIARRSLKSAVFIALAVASFVALFVFNVPFPFVILGAGLVGLAGGLMRLPAFMPSRDSAEPAVAYSEESRARPSWGRSLRVIGLGLLLWWLPVIGAGLWLGWDNLLVREGVFFSKAALVTFGGAYAVLPYVAQLAVSKFGWLSASQMLSGLGLAETTPGPLIMVVLFVGFLAGWQHPAPLTPIGMATAGALLTTWVTFVPCFMWIFLGAPFVERLYGSRVLSGALAAITAAVVGVVANLAVWFGGHVLAPDGKLDLFSLAVGLVVWIGLTRWKWNVVPVVIGAGVAGLLYQTLR